MPTTKRRFKIGERVKLARVNTPECVGMIGEVLRTECGEVQVLLAGKGPFGTDAIYGAKPENLDLVTEEAE